MNKRNEIIAKLKDIPAIPVSASKAINFLQNPSKGLSGVVNIFEYDPGMTANILKLANSASFASGREISSLQEAVVRLGATNVLQLLVSSSLAPYMKIQLKGYDLPPGELWKSAVKTAICADVIKQTLKLDLPDFTFTAGLLHDIGKIVLGSFIDVNPTEIIDYATANGLSFPEAESKILGIDHAEAGAILLRNWNLPEELEQPVRWHHSPEQCEDDSGVTAVIHIADALTLMSGVGAGTEGLNYRISEKVSDKLGLNTKNIELIICETQIKYEEICDLYMKVED